MHSRRQSVVEASRRSSVVVVDSEKGPAVAIVGEKPGALHTEYIVTEDGKEVQAVDYSGAHTKTDPKEIRLVKKLDKWIMPTIWIMVRMLPILLKWLTSLSVLVELSRQECHHVGSSEQARERTPHDIAAISNLR